MSAASEKARSRVVKIVGGGKRRSRQDSNKVTPGGAARAMRRNLRRSAKDKTLTPSARRSIKERVREMLVRKNQKD